MLSRTFEQYVKYMHARYETPSHVSDLHTTMNKKTLLTQCQTSNSAEKTQLKLTKNYTALFIGYMILFGIIPNKFHYKSSNKA